MVFALLSPAKTLTFDPVPTALAGDVTAPHFQTDAAKIVKTLQTYDVMGLSKLMGLSDKLSALNVERFNTFKARPTAKTEQAPAILAYRGDVYQGLDVDTLTPAQIRAAQRHIGMITGLYGVLQPLEAIQPYRLEMGTALSVGPHKNLYEYWGGRITARINELAKTAKAKAVIGLVSQEYLKAVRLADLAVPFINCEFKEHKNGKAQTVALFAKKARGMMARYIITHNVTRPEALHDFATDGYGFAPHLSTPHNFVFIR